MSFVLHLGKLPDKWAGLVSLSLSWLFCNYSFLSKFLLHSTSDFLSHYNNSSNASKPQQKSKLMLRKKAGTIFQPRLVQRKQLVFSFNTTIENLNILYQKHSFSTRCIINEFLSCCVVKKSILNLVCRLKN